MLRKQCLLPRTCTASTSLARSHTLQVQCAGCRLAAQGILTTWDLNTCLLARLLLWSWHSLPHCTQDTAASSWMLKPSLVSHIPGNLY